MVAAIEKPLGLRTAIKGSVLAKESSDEDLQAHVEGLIDSGFSECAEQPESFERFSRISSAARRSEVADNWPLARSKVIWWL